MMKSIKGIIYQLIPYGLLLKIVKRRNRNRSVIQYNPNLDSIPERKSNFKYIVSVQGLGFSGSGAVVDLLREYTSCLALGNIDDEGSKAKGGVQNYGELDFLRHSGGLFDIERYVGDNNFFQIDAALKRLKCVFNCCPLFSMSEPRKLANQFYNELVDCEFDAQGQFDLSWYVNNEWNGDMDMKIMKKLQLNQYWNLCQRFLTSLFNCFYKDGFQYLVLDQLCGDINFDQRHYQRYIPNIKTILVYRDPRDVYCFAINRNVVWIPHNSVNAFIKWFKILVSCLDMNSNAYLVVRFEDLVYDYNNQIKRIEDYLSLSSITHETARLYFEPKESMKNIGIWKNFQGSSEDLELIFHQLNDYCYE